MSVASIYCTRAEAKAAIFEYIEDFDNRQRHHSGFRHRVQNPKTGIWRYDLGDGRIVSVIKLSENRDEVHGGVAEYADATQSWLILSLVWKVVSLLTGFHKSAGYVFRPDIFMLGMFGCNWRVTPLLSGLEWRCKLGVLTSNFGVCDLTTYLSICSLRITLMAYCLAYGQAGRWLLRNRKTT